MKITILNGSPKEGNTAAMCEQLLAAAQRVYAIGKPAKAKKTALLLSSAAPGPYTNAIGV